MTIATFTTDKRPISRQSVSKAVAIAVALTAAIVTVALAVSLSVVRAADPGQLDDAELVALVRDLSAEGNDRLDAPRHSSAAARPRPWRGPRDVDVASAQAAAYAAPWAKGIIDLQPFRRQRSASIRDDRGRTARANLINLNPTINRWYLLDLRWADGREQQLHLVNERPHSVDLTLSASVPDALILQGADRRLQCPVWSTRNATDLDAARQRRKPFLRLCNGLTVLLETDGNRTSREWAAELLRDHVVGGEQLTTLVKSTLYEDSFLLTGQTAATSVEPPTSIDEGGPRPARLESAHRSARLEPRDLGIATGDDGLMAAGRWYAARHHPGVFVSVTMPAYSERPASRRGSEPLPTLDAVEATALTYLVAFDLAQFDLAYAVGTDHPRVDWSHRARDDVKSPGLPGPDGIDTIAPLVGTGIVPPDHSGRTVATFTGGFKRAHSAFRTSALALRNAGSHYGFVVEGTVMSKLQPGLATLVTMADGSTTMRTWSRDDDARLNGVRFARQNGLPLVETAGDGSFVPGPAVGRWGDGNWSGTADGNLRAVRAGACLQQQHDSTFLIYGYLSSATPPAMARVFLSYGCQYAMQLDMNALEHTYLALYHTTRGSLSVEHLIRGMDVLDKATGDQPLPRFLTFADNRDFFYVMRRPSAADAPGQPSAASLDQRGFLEWIPAFAGKTH